MQAGTQIGPISEGDKTVDKSAYLHPFSVVSAFPAIHSSPHVKHEFVANYSLLYTITGSNPNLTPYLLMSHLDVVPADNVNLWESQPFQAEIVQEFIYGRGTIDDKHGVVVNKTNQKLLVSLFFTRRIK
jgi:carboxypeptidase PM20D1